MNTITVADALRALEEAVAEKGENYVYDIDGACVYVEHGQPSCLVGNALHRLGVPLSDMEQYNRGYGSTELLRRLDLAHDEPACAAFAAAQEAQDLGRPWGEALRRAREEVGRA